MTTDYKVKLEIFEGPLDLLLYLIKRDELDIYDISIERITRQTFSTSRAAACFRSISSRPRRKRKRTIRAGN